MLRPSNLATVEGRGRHHDARLHRTLEQVRDTGGVGLERALHFMEERLDGRRRDAEAPLRRNADA
ncbi:hypothetical protein [Sphingomonas sp.]|uniref:hypothetical protein n=1 Tax=Sphingomonas sp. TaxID=28214 RepID=UPI003B00F601